MDYSRCFWALATAVSSSFSAKNTIYEDFSTGEDGGVVVGGAIDTVESQACALESVVDNRLLEACKAFEEQAERHHQKWHCNHDIAAILTVYYAIIAWGVKNKDVSCKYSKWVRP